MMGWIPPTLGFVLVCWTGSVLFLWPAGRKTQRSLLWSRLSSTLILVGLAGIVALIAGLWIGLDRPPLRTLGETRLWYAGLLPAIGLILEWRLHTPILRIPMLLFGILFVGINLVHPEALDKTLMPALQSPWFVPHVVVYMVAYAALGLSCGAAIWTLLRSGLARRTLTGEDLRLPMLLIHLGLPFLTFGLVFGALWAKEAWGHYWTWDPKETWAFLTWGAYLILIHLPHDKPIPARRQLWLIASAFVVLLACWFGLNYLPAANASVHSYTS